jgi:hypothetical protein
MIVEGRELANKKPNNKGNEERINNELFDILSPQYLAREKSVVLVKMMVLCFILIIFKENPIINPEIKIDI